MTTGEALEVMRKVALSRVARKLPVEWVDDGTRYYAHWMGGAEERPVAPHVLLPSHPREPPEWGHDRPRHRVRHHDRRIVRARHK